MKLDKNQIASVVYHDKFDYPLNKEELRKWKLSLASSELARLDQKDGYYFLKGRLKIINLRKKRQKYSQQKLMIAKNAGRLLSKIPFIKFVGITGSLAMMNADKTSDIDLMIITSNNTLWIARAITLLALSFKPYALRFRRYGEKDEENKLCLNLWLDESALYWKIHNEYTAHEIAQVMPLVNKDKIYERFLWENRWVLKHWPSAVRIMNNVSGITYKKNIFLNLINRVCFYLQLQYMRRKITTEVVNLHQAIFHPKKKC